MWGCYPAAGVPACKRRSPREGKRWSGAVSTYTPVSLASAHATHLILSQHPPTPPLCSHSAPLKEPSPRELRIGHGGEHRHGGARALAAPPRQLRHRPPVLPP